MRAGHGLSCPRSPVTGAESTCVLTAFGVQRSVEVGEDRRQWLDPGSGSTGIGVNVGYSMARLQSWEDSHPDPSILRTPGWIRAPYGV